MISEHLERVAGKSLTVLENILDIPLPDPADETFAVVVKAHNTAAATGLGTQTKVDENQLRKRGQDMMPGLVKLIQQYEQENPTRIKTIEGT